MKMNYRNQVLHSSFIKQCRNTFATIDWTHVINNKPNLYIWDGIYTCEKETQTSNNDLTECNIQVKKANIIDINSTIVNDDLNECNIQVKKANIIDVNDIIVNDDTPTIDINKIKVSQSTDTIDSTISIFGPNDVQLVILENGEVVSLLTKKSVDSLDDFDVV